MRGNILLGRCCLSLVFCIGFLFGNSVLAQSTARLTGTVTDSSGAVLPNAAVLCSNFATGIGYSATSDAGGVFRFPDLPVGTYNLTISHAGFTTFNQTGIVLVTGHDVDIPVKLSVGGTTQTVEVGGANQGIQPTSSVVQTSIESKSMQDLPLNGRNALQLVFLVPGAISQNDNPSFQTANTRIAVNGNRGTDNGYQLDGVNYIDEQYQTAPILPSPDAIQEFTAKTSNFSASQSGAGADIQFTTKSGTNQFHGALFEYLRNNYFDARNYFATKVTPFKRNQYGGAFGGPIFRNKTFFFGSYQGTRTVGGASPSVAQVPTALMRTGDFSQSGNIIIDPLTGAPFPGNQIPQRRFDPVMGKLASLYPLPNQANGTYISNPRTDQNDDQVLARIDHQLTSKDHLTARFFYDDFSFQEQTSALPSFYGADKFLNRNALLSDTHTFSSNLLLIAAFGYTNAGRVRSAVFPITPQEAGVNVPLATAGAPPQTSITVSTYASLLSGTPIVISPKSYDYRIHFTWSHGAHLIQGGLDVIRNDEYAFDRSFQSGSWTFNGSRTASTSVPKSGNSYADILLGLPFTFTQHGTEPQNISETKMQPWFEDDWKVLPRLTLNLGVRYEPWLPAIDHQAPQIGFLPGIQSVVAPNAPPGLVFSGDAGLPHSIFARDMNNVAPRIGFAYDVNGDARTVIRGAYGVFFRPSPLNLQRFSSNTAAFRSLATSISNPPSFADPYANTPGGSPFPWVAPTVQDLKTYTFRKPVTTSALIPRARTSYVQEWNLVVERQMTSNMAVSASYIGNHMVKGMDSTEGNPATYIPGQSTQANVDSRRPYKGLASLQILSPFSFSNYNALQLAVNRHTEKGLTLIGNYTWSKCMDNDSNTTGGIGVINKFDLNANYARCDFDISQLANISVVYDLPAVTSFHGFADKALNHWQLTTIMTLNGGGSFSVSSGQANSLTGPTTNSGTLDLADRVPGVSVARPAGVSGLQEYFNTAAFKPNALGTFGDSGRNSMDGPGSFGWDLGVLKTVPVTERIRVTLRGEAFNVLNHTNFSTPVATYTNSNFGKTISAGAPRVIQVALRLAF